MQRSRYYFSSLAFSFLKSSLMGSSGSVYYRIAAGAKEEESRLINSSHSSVSISNSVSQSASPISTSSFQVLNSDIFISSIITQILLSKHEGVKLQITYTSNQQILLLGLDFSVIQFCNCMDWKNKPNQIFNKVKQQMFSKGVQTFHYVDQFISQFDPSNTKVLSSHFFNLFLNKVGVFLTTQEIRNIRDLYSKNQQEDQILYQDFLQDVKYSISEKIAGLINQAFAILDSKNEGSVSLETLLVYYNHQQHPHSLTRRKSPEQVREEFKVSLQRKAGVNGRISKEAFIDYYAELNFCIPAEKQTLFEQLIVNTWNLKNPATFVSEKQLRQLQHTLFEKIRLKSDGKTNQWKTGKKALFYFDLGDNKQIGFEQFRRGLDKFGCNFKDFQLRALFEKYSQGGNLNYQEFSKAIMDIDINGMVSQPNLLQTKMGTNHFTVTH